MLTNIARSASTISMQGKRNSQHMDALTTTGLADDNDTEPVLTWRDTALSQRPGFLIRRLHQIHVALFMEECAAEGITPVQYSILTALEQLGPSEQVVLSRAVGLDRANTADVIARLESPVARAHERTIAALPVEERKTFLRQLLLLVEKSNELSRTPVVSLTDA